MGATCEIPVGGAECAVQAIGRCSTCGRAFCLTHQARVGAERRGFEERGSQGSSYTDWCSECRAAKVVAPILAQEQKYAQAAAERARLIRERRQTGWAAMQAYGFTRLAQPRFHTETHLEKGLFGRERARETREELEPAVPLGDLNWRFRGYVPRDGSVDQMVKRPTGITASKDIVLMTGRIPETLTFANTEAVPEALWRTLNQHGVKE